MEKFKEKKFVCKFCNKKFPSGKSLGGHIRIHTNEYSVDSDRYNGNRLRENLKKNKRLVDQRDIVTLKHHQQQQQQQQLCCRECGKSFDSLKALWAHIDCHSKGEKMLMDSQSDTETGSDPTRKRSKRVMKQSNSESFSIGSSSSASEINQEHKNTALCLMMMSRDSNFKKGDNLVVNSLGESSDNNSVVLETKSSSRKQLKIFNVKNQTLETNKDAANDQLRSVDDDNGAILCDSDSSDSDYFMNGPKKSDSDISVDRSLRNNGFGSGFNNSLNRFKHSDELRVKEGGGSKYELSNSKRVFPSYESGAHSLETDSCADTNRNFPVFKKASGAKKKSKGHECPICFRVFKSGQALGGHKRSHSIVNQEHRIEHQVAEMHHDQIDLNLPAMDIDE